MTQSFAISETMAINLDSHTTMVSFSLLFGYNNVSGGSSNATNRSSSSSSLFSSELRWSALWLTVVILMTAAGNVLVCLAVCWERRLQNMTNYFLMSLAIADLLVSLLVMPFAMVIEMYGYFPLEPNLCVVWASMDVLLCTASIWHMSTMSVDRYCTIRYPIGYGRNRTKTTVAIKIAFVWIISVAVSSGLAISGFIDTSNVYSDGQCVPVAKEFVLYGSLMAFYVPLVIMVVTYGLTVRILTENRRTMKELGMKASSARHQSPQPHQTRGTTGSNSKSPVEVPSISVEGVMRLATLSLPMGKNSVSSSVLTLPGISEMSGDHGYSGERFSSGALDPPICKRSRTPHARPEPKSIGNGRPMDSRSDTVESTRSLLSVSTASARRGVRCNCAANGDENGGASRSHHSPVVGDRGQSHHREDESQSFNDVADHQSVLEDTVIEPKLQSSASLGIGHGSSSNRDAADEPSNPIDACSCSPPQTGSTDNQNRDDDEAGVEHVDETFRRRAIVIDVSLLGTVSSTNFVSATSTQTSSTCLNDRRRSRHHRRRSSDVKFLEPTSRGKGKMFPSSPDRMNGERSCYSHSDEDVDVEFDVDFKMNIFISHLRTKNLRRVVSGNDNPVTEDRRVDHDRPFDYERNGREMTTTDGGNTRTNRSRRRDRVEVISGQQQYLQLPSPSFTSSMTTNSNVPSNAVERGTTSTSTATVCDYVTRRATGSRKWPQDRTERAHSQFQRSSSSQHVPDRSPANKYSDRADDGNERTCQPVPSTGTARVMTSATRPHETGIRRFDLPSNILPTSVATYADAEKPMPDHHFRFSSPMSRLPMPSSIFINRQRRKSAGVANNSSSEERTWSLTNVAGTSTSLEAPAVGSATLVKRHRSTSTNERKASKVLGIIFSVFIILWSPFFVVNVLSSVCGDDCNIHGTLGPTVMSWFVWLGYASSLANPFIYTVFSTKFRTVFRRIVTCQVTHCCATGTCRRRNGHERQDDRVDRWSEDRRRRASAIYTGPRVPVNRAAGLSDAYGGAASRRYSAGASSAIVPQRH